MPPPLPKGGTSFSASPKKEQVAPGRVPPLGGGGGKLTKFVKKQNAPQHFTISKSRTLFVEGDKNQTIRNQIIQKTNIFLHLRFLEIIDPSIRKKRTYE